MQKLEFRFGKAPDQINSVFLHHGCLVPASWQKDGSGLHSKAFLQAQSAIIVNKNYKLAKISLPKSFN